MSDTVTGRELDGRAQSDPAVVRYQASYEALALLLKALGPDDLTADELDTMVAVMAPVYVRKEAAKLKAAEGQLRMKGRGRRLVAVSDPAWEVTR